MALNWGGATKGAISGGTLGSTFGPWGTVAGGVIGGTTGLLTDWFGGGDSNKAVSPNGIEQISTKSPEQQKGLAQIYQNMNALNEGGYNRAQQHLSGYLSGDPEHYNQFSAPYLQQFEQQLIPRLTERFASLGGGMAGGVGSSSGLGQAIGGAGANLQAQLAQQYGQRQDDAARSLTDQYNNLAQLGLGMDTTENVPRDEGKDPWGGIASLLAERGLSHLIPQLSQWLQNRGGNNSLQDSISNAIPSGPYSPNGASYNPYTGVQ